MTMKLVHSPLHIAVLAGAAFLTAQAACAETIVFKDVLRPHGVARGMAAKLADGRACGATDAGAFTNVPALETCMRGRGWVRAAIRPDPSDTAGATYDDMRPGPGGQSRGNDILEADARICDPTGRANVKSAKVKSCMASRGWRLSFVIKPSMTTTPAHNVRTYIDPNTGMECHNAGGAAVCDPPHGTVKYYDPELGENCTRTGIVSVCSNF